MNHTKLEEMARNQEETYPTPPRFWAVLPVWVCCRCDNEWTARTTDYPKRCPECNSKAWARETAPRIGRAALFDWETIQVGELATVPADNYRGTLNPAEGLLQSLSRFATGSRKKFYYWTGDEGLIVGRLPDLGQDEPRHRWGVWVRPGSLQALEKARTTGTIEEPAPDPRIMPMKPGDSQGFPAAWLGKG